MRKEPIRSILYFLLFLFLVISIDVYADTGRFGILIFGGAKAGLCKGEFDDEPIVQYEIAPMFENIVDTSKYDFNNDDVYVFNLTGIDDSTSYYEHFNINPANYFEADSSEIKNNFHSINYELHNNDQNLVFLYIAGHQGQGPSGDTNYYRLYDYDITDADFARWIDNDLLDYTYNVKSRTRIIVIAGFCAAWKFFDPEVEDVCQYIYYAVADSQNNDVVDAFLDDRTFLSYYKNEMNGTACTFSTAFLLARSTLYEYYFGDAPEWGDTLDFVVKKVKGGNWDSEWSLYGDIVAPDAPENLAHDHNDENGHPVFVWDANSEPDLKEYEVWRRPAYETYWEMLGTTEDTYWTDTGVGTLDPAARIFYKIRAVDLSDNKSSFSNEAYVDGFIIQPKLIGDGYRKHIPLAYFLSQNFPNPFNPTTTIELALPESEFVELKIYNCTGSEVATLVATELPSAFHTFKFDGGHLASGVYYYRISAGGFHDVKKMILLR